MFLQHGVGFFNRSDGHIRFDFLLSDFLQGGHGDTDVVQVLDGPAQAFADIVDERERALHLVVVFVIARLAVMQAPTLRLRQQTELQLL